MYNISEAIIEKFGYREGLSTRGGKITAWPYEEAKPSAQEIHDLVTAYNEKAAYKKARQEEYPSTEDQLDMIYHRGVTGWKVFIKAIKTKYPKP